MSSKLEVHPSSAAMKVVFLDCDGVVSPFGKGGLFAAKQMSYLKQILDATGARLVLSSSWRTTAFGREEVTKQLAAFGMPSFISVTPELVGKSRAEEILAWIAVNGKKYNVVNFVALDDINLPAGAPDRRFFSHHAVTTNSTSGLTEADAKRAIALLAPENNII